MTTGKMPSFKLRKPDISDADVAYLGDRGKFLDSGRHDVKIKSVIYKGPNKKDPTFHGYEVTYANAGGAEKREHFMAPTESLKFAGGKGKAGQLFPYSKLASLFRGLGEVVTPATIWSLIVKYFGQNKLVNRTLSIDVEFTKAHIAYLSKDSYELRDRDGNPILGGDGGPIAGTKNEVQKEAIILGLIEVQEYPEVAGHVPVEPKEEEGEDSAEIDEDVF